MTRVPISDLTAADPLDDDDVFPIVQGGVTKKAAMADVITAATSTLGLVAPAASAAAVSVNVADTPFRIPELTTASFTMPDRPVFVNTSSFLLGVSGSLGSGDPYTDLQIRYTKDGWATSHLAETRAATWVATGIEGSSPLAAMLPPTGGTALAAGDTVQVALFVKRSDTTRTVTVNYISASGIFPWLHVIAG